MKFYNVIFIILITFLSDKALANWELTATGAETGDEFYVDMSRITDANNYRYYWVLKNYPRIDEYGSRSATMYFQADCDVKRQKILSFNFYTGHMATGDVDTQEPSSEFRNWRYPSPGGVFLTNLEAACE
tara:strand:- start:3778 stop:4167 length:390 start_codon:yes stop_codon:yes gene_type:complete